MTRRKRYAALAVLATAAVAGGILAGSRGRAVRAAGPHRRRHGEHPLRRLRAMEQALGRAAAGRGRPGLDEARRRLGEPEQRRLLRLRQRHPERRRPAADGADADDADRGAEDRAGQEHVRRLQEQPARSGSALLLRNAFPLPGPRARLARLHHAHQPRRRRRPPGHAAGDEGRHGREPGDDRRLDLGAVGRAAAVHHREPECADLCGHSGLPVHRHRCLGRAGPRRLRGNPGRQRRQHLDRRGHRRVEQARHDRKDPQQLHLPLRPQDQGRSREREAAGPAGAERQRATRSPRPRRRRRSTRPTRSRFTPTARASRRSG